MRKHTIIGLFIILTWVTAPIAAHAIGFTQPFGARVISTTIPSVTCFPPGTGPVTMSRVGMNVAGGIYSAIPLYTTSPFKVPQSSGWILGRHEMFPSFGTCYEAQIPYPVIKTTIYGVSKRLR